MNLISKTALFILTNGRPDNQLTLQTLEKLNCTADIFLVCDDNDKTLSEYIERYGEKVKIFNKNKIKKEMKIDMCDNFNNYLNCVFLII